MIFGLLSFGVLIAGFGEDVAESGSEPGVLSWRAVRVVAGDFLWGTSEVPTLFTVTHMPISEQEDEFRSKRI